VQPPVVRAQTTRHSLAARDLDAGSPSAAHGRQPTTFLQQDEAGQERQARVVRRGRLRKFRLLLLFMSLLGIGFLFATPHGGVSGFGRRSNEYVQHLVEKGKSWTATQLEFVQRWQYGVQLFDLYSAVRRGQWPASSVGGPRRASGRRVFLRDVQSGHYVRVVTHEEEPEKRAHSRNLGKLGSVQPGELIADQPVPWLHGGVFELYDARKTLLRHSVREGGTEPEKKEHLLSSSLWQSVSKLAKKGRLQGADDTRWELLNRASQGGGFVAVSWRSTFLDYLFSWNATWSDFAHGTRPSIRAAPPVPSASSDSPLTLSATGVYVGALSARTFRSSDATALRAEMLPPGPPPEGPRRGVSGVELARVRLRAPGRLGVDGADDWMGGARFIVVDPETGALRVADYAGEPEPGSVRPAEFAVEAVEPLKGVNLGSWLIPEHDYAVVTNESLCEYTEHVGAAKSNRVMEEHLSTFLTEADFDWMASHGVNAVRVPLGWWNVLHASELPDPGTSKAWTSFAPSPEVSMAAIGQVLDWAADRSMSVLLDLHGGPGGQNGKDHSGCHGVAEWHEHSVNNSLLVISALMERFGDHDALWGVELLNEPGDLSTAPLEDEMRPKLVQYYEAAYAIIRSHRPDVAVVFCVLYWFDFWAWAGQLREPRYFNVVTDYHMYTAFDGFDGDSPDSMVEDAARAFGCRLMQHAYHHPAVVGEWALAVDRWGQKVKQGYVDAQLTSYNSSLGSYFWTYVMDSDAGMAEWGITGTKPSGADRWDTVGPSPQWDFTVADEERPNERGEFRSHYDFPNLRKWYPSAPGAPSLEQLRAGTPVGAGHGLLPPPPITDLPRAEHLNPDPVPPCGYVSPTGVALLAAALIAWVGLALWGCVSCCTRCCRVCCRKHTPEVIARVSGRLSVMRMMPSGRLSRDQKELLSQRDPALRPLV